jgi:hypothetical protein
MSVILQLTSEERAERADEDGPLDLLFCALEKRRSVGRSARPRARYLNAETSVLATTLRVLKPRLIWRRRGENQRTRRISRREATSASGSNKADKASYRHRRAEGATSRKVCDTLRKNNNYYQRRVSKEAPWHHVNQVNNLRFVCPRLPDGSPLQSRKARVNSFADRGSRTEREKSSLGGRLTSRACLLSRSVGRVRKQDAVPAVIQKTLPESSAKRHCQRSTTLKTATASSIDEQDCKR